MHVEYGHNVGIRRRIADADIVPGLVPEVLVLARAVLLRLSSSPRVESLVRRSSISAPLVRRFIAGETMEATVDPVRALNSRGMTVTLDYLGENVTSLSEAEASAEYCRRLIRHIAENSLDANVSLKLTQLGLDIGVPTASDHLSSILSVAQEHGQFVRVDMESSAHTDRTFEVFESVWPEHRNVGMVIQSYLYRSDADIARLNAAGVRVRLVKGAYDEPATVAYRRKADVDAAYLRMMRQLLKDGVYPAIATHDERLIRATREYARAEGIGADQFEFQMLYGIRRDLQEALVRDGYRMRVYTPFGTEWYGYMMRRLAERPANLWFVAKNMLRR